MTERERLATKRRAVILDSAEAVFFRVGFQKATIAQITSGAGVALGTLYGYFSSKSEVLRFLISTRQGDLRAALREAIRGADDGTHEIVRSCLDWLGTRPGLLRLVRETEFLEPELAAGFYRDLTAQLRQTFDRSMERGRIAEVDTEMLAGCVVGMVELVVLHETSWGDAGPLSTEKINAAAGIILRALGPTTRAD